MKTEQIEKASVEYATKTAEDYCECNSEFVQELMVAFERGAKYALSHQWVSVDEALPEVGKEVLLYDASSIRHCVVGCRREKRYNISQWILTNGYVEDRDITHWMPIPKLNNEAEKGAGK